MGEADEPDAGPEVLTDREPNERVAAHLDGALSGVRCRGEVRDLAVRSSAVSFDLVGGEASVNCFVWRSRSSSRTPPRRTISRDDEIDERARRVEEMIERLEAGEADPAEGRALLAEGRELVAEQRELLDREAGVVEEL